jgi:hypothetical protein
VSTRQGKSQGFREEDVDEEDEVEVKVEVKVLGFVV